MEYFRIIAHVNIKIRELWLVENYPPCVSEYFKIMDLPGSLLF